MTEPVDLVNPFQGTDSHFDLSRGNTYPAVAMPWGMNFWSPQTSDSRWMYDHRSPRLQGIRCTHSPSPWMGDYGQFTVMPVTGDPSPGPEARSSYHRHADTTCGPHRFRTRLMRYDIGIEVVPTMRGACFRFSFPADAEAAVMILPAGDHARVEIVREAGRVLLVVKANSGGVPDNFAHHVIAEFDAPVISSSMIRGDQVGNGTTAEGRVGAILRFGRVSRPVHLRIATSFIDARQAALTFAREVSGRGIDELESEARSAWNGLLGRVRLDGADERQRATFYSCLYRCLLFPRVMHEPDEMGALRHYSPYDGKVHPGEMVTDNGFWDTFRTVYPLLSVLYPDHLRGILAGWMNAYREGGWFPKWASPGYRNVMIGTHSDAVFADAAVKGIGGFDLDEAYAGLIKNATVPGDPEGHWGRKGLAHYLEKGWVAAEQVEGACARTQEFAYGDFCVAQVAALVGATDAATMLRDRSGNWRHCWDPEAGFMRGRDADGSWTKPWSEFRWGGEYVEGGPWQWSWAVPHDAAGLIAAHGGDQTFVERLDLMLATPPRFEIGTYPYEIHEMTEMAAADFGQYAHSNQPVHHVLYLYPHAGRPDRLQYWARRICAELYGPGPDGFPGDEDNGEMSAWYVMSSLGFFPLCPGHPSYVLGSPLFPRAELRIPGAERPLVIEAVGQRADAPYIQSANLDGLPYDRCWIPHDLFTRGGTLSFVMGTTPSAWGSRPQDRPFSFSATQRSH